MHSKNFSVEILCGVFFLYGREEPRATLSHLGMEEKGNSISLQKDRKIQG
jgi:hypothetical protein